MSIFRTGLSPLAMQRARAIAVGAYGDTCTIRRLTGRASDGRGGWTPVYADDPGTVPCDVQYGASSEEAVNQRYQGNILGTIYLPIGTAISTVDLIVPSGGTPHRVAGPAYASSDDLGLAVPVVKTDGDDGA